MREDDSDDMTQRHTAVRDTETLQRDTEHTKSETQQRQRQTNVRF